MFLYYVLISQKHMLNKYNYGWRNKVSSISPHFSKKMLAFPLEDKELTSQFFLDYTENGSNMLFRNTC
jgi:hypothetical protein